ncbi:MAG: hypothetical protein WKG52_12305 [Variovorax sp.]
MADPDLPSAVAESVIVKQRFAGVVLVCRECEKRSSGPSKLKAKELQKEFKRNLGALRPVRVRIVQSGCLGMCPKKRIAVVAMAPGRPLCAAELRRAGEAEAVVAALQPLPTA